jgi:hypothetical protein
MDNTVITNTDILTQGISDEKVYLLPFNGGVFEPIYIQQVGIKERIKNV